MLFTGQAEITIDAKQRLSVPSKFRARMPEPGGDAKASWFCVPWPDGPLLRLYPDSVFERLASLREDSLTPDEDIAALEATLFGYAEQIDMDAAGRVRLPKLHLDLVEMPSEVVVIGVRNRLEIRSRAAWQGSEKQRFKDLASLVRRIESRPGGA